MRVKGHRGNILVSNMDAAFNNSLLQQFFKTCEHAFLSTDRADQALFERHLNLIFSLIFFSYKSKHRYKFAKMDYVNLYNYT